SLLSGHIGGEVYERGSTAQHHIGVLGGRLSVRCIAVDLNHHGRSAARYVETEKLSIAQLVERHGARVVRAEGDRRLRRLHLSVDWHGAAHSAVVALACAELAGPTDVLSREQ